MTTISTKLKATRTTSTKELAVIASFTNGFAERVLQLSDGTIVAISYSEDRVRIVEGEFLNDPATEIPQIVNSTEEDNDVSA